MSNAIEYRRHIIKVMQSKDGWKARALRGSKIASDIVQEATKDAAIAAVKQILDDRATELRSSRGTDDYPCQQEVREALKQIRPSDSQRLMLEAHIAAADRVLTATQLALAAGYDDYVVANGQYGSLGRALAEEMEWEPAQRSDGSPIWTFALATDGSEQPTSEGAEIASHWRWRLRPEVAEAWMSIVASGGG
ncbi:hypothetical protein [Sphingomonas crocodyli]|uniref:Uncharacterized protein n=1 Tax=Sphingomonas crocodyli TaxID=1979270 RepID=A0A437M615_9SPHN|nr:hypothetical protein [Sphingomonas crocodyli]RVT93148.1 hypothetical protein EOD43_04450 [Sphingomonas crocodyli]